MRAVDSTGNADDTPAAVDWTVDTEGANLLANPSFEATRRGWDAVRTTSRRTKNAAVGTAALRVARDGEPVTHAFGVTANPKPVSSAVAETAYVARAWVRSRTPGKTVCLRLVERAPSGNVLGSARVCRVARWNWRRFDVVRYQIWSTRSTVAVDVVQRAGRTGDTFDVDGFIVRAL